MTYFRATNDSGIISIDEDSYSYVYLGKWTMAQANSIGVYCVGYPLIFFELPYAHVNQGENDAESYSSLRNRCGLAMVRVQPVPGSPNRWAVTMAGAYDAPGELYIRVFGKLHTNFPQGAGLNFGARFRNAQNELFFDSGCRQLKLSGNTYDIEMAVNATMPGYNTRPSATDSTVAMPFNMAGKSIMANTRGAIRMPYQYGQYYDVGLGVDMFQYESLITDTVFWANGNTLYAKKSCSSTEYFDVPNGLTVVSTGALLYTRVAVIDNSSFP